MVSPLGKIELQNSDHRVWTGQRGPRLDKSVITLPRQQLLPQLPVVTFCHSQRKCVAFAQPSWRIRREWWSFSFCLHLAYPLKGKLATSNNTLAMTNSEVNARFHIPGTHWLKQRVLAQKGVPQTKWKSSSQMDSKTQRKKEKWRLGDETVYLEFDRSHSAQRPLWSWACFENTTPLKRSGFDGNFHTWTFALLFREVLKSVGEVPAPPCLHYHGRAQILCPGMASKTFPSSST